MLRAQGRGEEALIYTPRTAKEGRKPAGREGDDAQTATKNGVHSGRLRLVASCSFALEELGAPVS